MKFPKFFSFKKGRGQKKDTPIKENTDSYSSAGTGELYKDPQYEKRAYSDIATMYDMSSLLKKYIRTIVNDCLRYPLKAKPIKGKEKDPRAITRAAEVNKLLTKANQIETFREIRDKYLKDIFLYGRAGIEIQPTIGHTVKSLYAVPGYCIRLNVDNTGSNFKSKAEAFRVLDPNDSSKVAANFPADSFIYFVFDKLSDRVYGSNPVDCIYRELYTDVKSSQDLERGANDIKAGIVCLPKAPKKLLERVISKFHMLIKNKSRTKLVAVNVEGKFVDLSNASPEQVMSLQKHLAMKANIFNIPPFKLGMSVDGGLNAREQRDEFRGLIENIVQWEAEKLTAILVWTKLKYDDIEVYSPNLATKAEYEKARVAVRLVKGGLITPNEGRVRYLGLNNSKDETADKLQNITVADTPAAEPNQQAAESKEKDIPTQDVIDAAFKLKELELKIKKGDKK